MAIPRDIVDIIFNTHGVTKERLTMLKKALPLLNGNALGNKLEEISNFLNKYVVRHFENEETIFFILKRDSSLNPEEAKIVEEIINEHTPLIAMLEKFNSHLKSSADDKDIKEIVTKIGVNLVELLLNHAKKEDNEMFPIIRRRITVKQLNEVEHLISGHGTKPT